MNVSLCTLDDIFREIRHISLLTKRGELSVEADDNYSRLLKYV
jgi:hypothetical protein